MKKLFLFVAMMLCCVMTMFAQNDKISYQAVVRDTENKLVPNKSVEVTVHIYNGDATTAAYTETKTVTTNLNGLISLQIGPDGTDAGWNSIEWNKARFETTVKLDGIELGTIEIPFTAVPYAMYAKYTDNVAPLDIAAQMHDTANNVRNEVNTQVTNLETEINNLQNADANLSQRITADSNRLVNFKAKEYADSLALAGQITTLSNNVDNKTGALSDRIAADSTNLVNFKAKVHEDSLALVTLINTKADAESVYTKQQVYTKAEVDALLNELRQSMPVMAQDSFTVAQAGQTEFTLKNVPHAEHVLRMYINGVMVGGNHSGVLTTTNDPTSKVVEYNANQNKNRDGDAYNLKAGDKVTIVYWYVKPVNN